MANRDLIQYAEAGGKKCPMQYDLRLSEINVLYSLAKSDGLFQALSTAFKAGFEAGYRSSRKKMRAT